MLKKWINNGLILNSGEKIESKILSPLQFTPAKATGRLKVERKYKLGKGRHRYSFNLFISGSIVSLLAIYNGLKMSKSSNIIIDITPFNDFYYKSCFYTALFTAVSYFHKDISDIILNDIKTYGYNTQDGTLDYQLKPCEELDSIMEQMNLTMKSKKVNHDFLRDLHHVIDKRGIAIIMVDSYYESIRKDTYMKQHIPHSLLCFGYDDDKQEAYIVEHLYKDSLSYNKMTISYEDITEAYQGYIVNYYQESDYPTYYEIYQSEKVCEEIKRHPKQSYMKNINNNKDILLNSLAQFVLFIENFEGTMYSESAMKKGIIGLLNSIVNVVNIRKVESLALHKVFNNEDDLLKSYDKALADLEKSKKLLAKYMYSLHYEESFFEQVIDYLNESYECDCCFLQNIWNSSQNIK